nr:mucin-5AC-like [Procambarus clarkii]
MAGGPTLTILATTGILLLIVCLSEANSTFPLEEDIKKDDLSEYDYSEEDAGIHGTEKTRSGLCVPDCSRDGAIRLDRTSCKHYFVCSLQHQHLVLLRCTCPPHAPVFNSTIATLPNPTTATTTTSDPTIITSTTIFDTSIITNTATSSIAAASTTTPNSDTTPSPTTTTITATTSISSINTNVTVSSNALSSTTTSAVVPPFLDTATTTITTLSPAAITTHSPVTATISVPFSVILPATVTTSPEAVASPTLTLPLNAIFDLIPPFPATFTNIDKTWFTLPSTITTLSIATTIEFASTITPTTIPETVSTTSTIATKPPLTSTASTIPETVLTISILSPASATPVSVSGSLDCNAIQCMSINSRVQDKYNCSRYYKCVLQEGRLVPRPYICPNVLPVFSHFLQLCLTGIKCRAPCPTTTAEAADVVEVLAGDVGNITIPQEISVSPLLTNFNTNFTMTSELFADTTASPEMATGLILMPTDTADEVITSSKNVTNITELFETSTLFPISSEKPVTIPVPTDTPTVTPSSTNASNVPITDISAVGPTSSDTTSFVSTLPTTSEIILTASTSETSSGLFIIPVITAATLTDDVILFETSTSATSADTVSAIYETTTGVPISTNMTEAGLGAPTNTTQSRPHVSEEATAFPGMPEVVQVTATPGWEGTCELSCPAPDMKVGDPRDCHYFFICRFTDNLTLKPIRVKCPLRRPMFKAGTGECVERFPCLAKCPASTNLIFLPPPQPTSSSPLVTFSNSTPATYTSLSPYPTNFDIITNTIDTPSSNGTFTIGATTSPSTITTNLPADCNPTCLVADSWLADPTDCHFFYVCHFINDVIARPRRIRCPTNRPIFNQELGRCTAEGRCITSCKNLTSTSEMNMSLAELDAPNCHPTCVLPNSRMSDPTDCYYYYICVILDSLSPRAVRTKCPQSKPFFDSRRKVCVAEAECIITCSQLNSTTTFTTAPSLADDVCNPVCLKPETVVADPRDCNHYYICSATDGIIISPTRMRCPSHLPVFDHSTSSCNRNAKCVVTCQSNTTATTTTPASTTLSLSNILSNNTMVTSTPVNDVSSTVGQGHRPKQCRPNCTSHNTIHHDPLDCHYYYVCMIGRGKSYLTRIQCPPRRPIFHLPTYSCQRAVPCITTCKDIVVPPSYATVTSSTVEVTSSTTWNISSSIGPTSLTSEAISSSTGAGISTTWNASSSTWNVSSSTGHTSPTTGVTSPTTWNVSSSTGHTSPTTWNVSSSTGHTSPTTGVTSPTTWNVSSSTGHTSPTTGVTSPTTWNVSSPTGHTSPTTWNVSSSTGHTSPITWNVSSSTGHTSPITEVTSPITWNVSSSTGHTSPITEVTSPTTWNISSSTGDASPTTEVTSSTTWDVSSSTGDTTSTAEDTSSTSNINSIISTTEVSSSTITGDANFITTNTGDIISTSPTTVDISFTTTATENITTNGEGENNTGGVVRCDPVCPKAGVLVADLSNCHRYFVCVYVDSLAPRPIRATCPTLTPVFDVTKRRCVADAPCYQPCAPHLLPSTQVSPAATGSTTSDLLLPVNSPISGGSLGPGGSPESGASGEVATTVNLRGTVYSYIKPDNKHYYVNLVL